MAIEILNTGIDIIATAQNTPPKNWLKAKVRGYKKEYNTHVITVEKPERLKGRTTIDFFVGCAIEVPTDPYDEARYDEIAFSLVGKTYMINERCWSERHQMWLPEKDDILLVK